MMGRGVEERGVEERCHSGVIGRGVIVVLWGEVS